jgi:adenylate kinase
MFIVLIGIQGSGKGTQGDLLSKKLGIPHLSTGDVLREMASHDTPEGKEIKNLIDNGIYLSDEQMLAILKKNLPKDVILDGYPRTLRQAIMLDTIENVDVALYINLHEEEAKRRVLLRGRTDDTPDAIHRRMQQYHAEADAIIEYYKGQGKLVEINGDQEIEAVFKDVCSELHLD